MTTRESANVVVEVQDGHHVTLDVREVVVVAPRLFGAGHRLEVPRAQAEEWIAAGDVVEVDHATRTPGGSAFVVERPNQIRARRHWPRLTYGSRRPASGTSSAEAGTEKVTEVVERLLSARLRAVLAGATA
jgi:hypothetical protein